MRQLQHSDLNKNISCKILVLKGNLNKTIGRVNEKHQIFYF